MDKITKLYDSVSKEYADAFSGEHEKKPMDREILSRFSQEVGNENPVWDLGCGPGQTTNYLRNLGIQASGLDISGQMLDQARHRHPDIHFRQGNILALEFEDNSIAAILSFYAMVHFTKDQVYKAFREIHRVLRPNGLFLFTYHVGQETIRISEFLGKQIDMDFMFFTTDFITGCLTDCGFKQIDTIERDPYPGVEYQSRRAYLFATKPGGE
ncbi:MAG: class I SAM-dependent methyltransferase [Desulfobacterales bacterium]|nr:class I SAM-dependent methyltransferase [Desulfobacterales bacterium]